jgi:hypothetical protein
LLHAHAGDVDNVAALRDGRGGVVSILHGSGPGVHKAGEGFV